MKHSERQAGTSETVLVVDDEPILRMLISEVLEEQGYVAIEAGDAASGLRLLQSDKRIDLLITDVGLPGGMDGRQMADAALQRRPDLRVLFITGYTDAATSGDERVRAGIPVLIKPFAMDALAARLREMSPGGHDPRMTTAR
jgi:CheY-like chemotaxis protein